MKHAHNTTAVAAKAMPKTASTHGAHKVQGKKPQGNSHSRDELVRLSAYSFYEARQGADGSDLDDWLRAEAHVDQLAAERTSYDTTAEMSPRAAMGD